MTAKYDFEEDFQRKIAACVLKDITFNRRTEGLIKPDYFEKDTESAVVNAALRYFSEFESLPTLPVLWNYLKDDAKAKLIRSDILSDIKSITFPELIREDTTDAKYISEQVAVFARHKAMESAALEYVELIERGDYEKAAKVVSEASNVGVNDAKEGYDFFGEKEVNIREQTRNDRLAGVKRSKNVISTGIRGLDARLFHKGWAKKEFYVMMGPPKSGKSISLAYFAKNAAMQGSNVLFVTLEVSKEITAERLDSSITGFKMDELDHHIIDAKEKIIEASKKAGKLIIEEFPTGTMTPNMLSRVIQKWKGKGVVFDMIVVDYADIMAPNIRTNEPIENSKSIYVDLRALAQIEDVVMLSAMQTNREGAKATTARMEHAAEDFNKIRIPDLVISINKTEEERMRNEARLFFAASRNQSGEFSIFIKQDLEKMAFIESIIKVE